MVATKEINSINSMFFFWSCPHLRASGCVSQSRLQWNCMGGSGGGGLGETVVCLDSSVVKGSVLTKQSEQSSPGRTQCRRCLWSPALSGPSAGVDLFGGRKNKKCRANGRLKLFVPGREDRQLHSRLVLRSGLHSVPCPEKNPNKSTNTQGGTAVTGTLNRRDEGRNKVEGGKIPKKKQKKQQHPSPPREKQRKSFPQNKVREIQITSALERKKRKRLSAAKIPTTRFLIWTGLQHHFQTSQRRKEQEKLKKTKRLPSKTQSILYISTPF